MNRVEGTPASVAWGELLWQGLASIRLTVFLLLLLVIDLSAGYLSLIGQSIVFDPMNQVGLWTWIETYGMGNLQHTWRFLLLLVLLLLVINTLVCTVDRLRHLAGRWRSHGWQGTMMLSLSTHIMHLGMVIMLVGYLASYTLSKVRPGIALTAGREVGLFDLRLQLLELILEPYSGDRLAAFAGRAIHPLARFQAGTGGEVHPLTIGFNQPARYRGYSFFLQRVNPVTVGGMRGGRYIVIDIRRDPGISLAFFGIAVFLCGLAGYVALWFRFRPTRRP